MNEVLQKLGENFQGTGVVISEGGAGCFFVSVPKELVRRVCNFLKENSFNYLSSLCGVEQKDCLEVIYHIGSIEKRDIITLKTRVPKENAVVSTVEDIFPSASLFERETYEMLGIKFDGHHDLRRLLLPEDWEGYPLRKDYKYPQEYHGILHDRGGSVDRTLKR
jgi:NADH-quinone oxidoreductase subunit C